MKKYYYYKCPLCDDILRREKKVKFSICGKKGERVKLIKMSKRKIKKILKGCNEDTGCDGCEYLDEETLDCKLDIKEE